MQPDITALIQTINFFGFLCAYKIQKGMHTFFSLSLGVTSKIDHILQQSYKDLQGLLILAFTSVLP